MAGNRGYFVVVFACICFLSVSSVLFCILAGVGKTWFSCVVTRLNLGGQAKRSKVAISILGLQTRAVVLGGNMDLETDYCYAGVSWAL